MKNDTHVPEQDDPHVYDVELTDTFGGEANYTWVKRAEVKFDKPYTEMALRRAIKEAVGLTGVRCNVECHGDGFTFRPLGLLQVCFANFRM